MLNRTVFRARPLGLAIAAALLCGAAAASAADGGGVRTLTVRFADVSLASAAGASALYQRIEGAARFVCGEPGRRLDEQRDFSRCYRQAVDQAVTAVDNPMLTAIHQRQSPGSVTAMR